MIPEEIVRFLEGATVGFAATRDAHLVPHIHFVAGWIVGDDRKTITCFFPPNYSKVLMPSLQDNGQFALTVLGSTSGPKASKPPRPDVDFHECYQFKGDYATSRLANAADAAVVERKGESFRKLFVPLFGFSEEACAARFKRPALAMTFPVREIFDQTPGPGAGRRVET